MKAKKQRATSSLAPEAVKKLRSSGLDRADAELLGMYSVEDASTLCPSFEADPALVIPYFSTDGKPLRAHKAWPDFYRIRYLTQPKTSFKSMVVGERGKYEQPPRTGTVAYFPQGYVDWKEVSKDSYAEISITEGELKAAKACKEGFPTIGLGGVWNFKSKALGASFLPELEDFDWLFRKVNIVFDSDARSKPMIMEAVMALTHELNARGAVVRMVNLPDVYTDGTKTGIDDFLVNRNDVEYADLLAQGLHLNAMDALMDMNMRFLYVEDTGIIVDTEQNRKFPYKLFTTTSTWAVRKICVTQFKKNGDSTLEQINSAEAWAEWPLRNSVDGLTYRPGEKRYLTDDTGRTLYNEWLGWGCEPEEGDVTPFLDLIDFLFLEADAMDKEWFLDWLTHAVQFPAHKMFAAVLMYGRVHGTGKTLVFYTMAEIFGENFIEIGNDEIQDTWWLAGKNFVLGDEITGSDRRKDADKLKRMITRKDAVVNIKFMPQYTIPDYVNYAFTSNHPAPLLMEDSDRRYFVHEVTAKKPLSEEFYTKYGEWLKNGGASHLFHWFLQRDIAHFNPNAPARRTMAKGEMTRMAKSDMELWCTELAEDSFSKMFIGREKRTRHTRCLFTTKELMDMYVSEVQPQYTPSLNGFSRALKTAGLNLAYKGNPIQDADQRINNRYWIVRDQDYWAYKATRQQCIDEILKEPESVAGKTKLEGSGGDTGIAGKAVARADTRRVPRTVEVGAPRRRRKL